MKKIVGGVMAAWLGILAALILTCGLEPIQVQGTTMEPTLPKGSHVLVYKWAYLTQNPQKGDLVAFPCDVYSEDGEGSILIKRVAATEGDYVEIKDGAFYVNGRRSRQGVAHSAYMDDMKGTVIKKDRIFVLSEDPTGLLDSRDRAVGQLDIREVTGKIWPEK